VSEAPSSPGEGPASRLSESGDGVNPLSKIRHSLRTPLNQILGYSEMLQEEATEKGQEDFLPDLQKIHAAGQQLLGLINEQLAPTRVATGRFDLADFQRDGRTLLNLIVGYSEICEEDAAEGEQGAMGGDLRRIRTAAGNLLLLLSDATLLEPLTRPRPAAGTVRLRSGSRPRSPSATASCRAVEAQSLVGRVLVVDDDEMNRDLLLSPVWNGRGTGCCWPRTGWRRWRCYGMRGWI
jgi:adenylate cyclase